MTYQVIAWPKVGNYFAVGGNYVSHKTWFNNNLVPMPVVLVYDTKEPTVGPIIVQRFASVAITDQGGVTGISALSMTGVGNVVGIFEWEDNKRYAIFHIDVSTGDVSTYKSSSCWKNRQTKEEMSWSRCTTTETNNNLISCSDSEDKCFIVS